MTTEISIAMLPAKLESEVIVVSAAPIIAVENTKLATNIDAEELKDLPVSRSVSAVLNLVPGVVGGSVFNSGTRENSWNIDGVQVTDPGSGSGMSATQSMDAYEEVQIETAGHPAELGNAGGAVVNVITKSGWNTFSGEAAYFTNSTCRR
jgi:outer membrane receptor protein involved in Fe transport